MVTVDVENMKIGDMKVEAVVKVVLAMNEELVDTKVKGWLWMRGWWIQMLAMDEKVVDREVKEERGYIGGGDGYSRGGACVGYNESGM